MKEAQGELNLTMVTVISVAILLSFFYTVIWPMLKDNQTSVTKCSSAICGDTPDGNGDVSCDYYKRDKDGVLKLEQADILCPWKG